MFSVILRTPFLKGLISLQGMQLTYLRSTHSVVANELDFNIVSLRVSSMGQISLFENYLYLIVDAI